MKIKTRHNVGGDRLAFTLIELLAVMVIVFALVGIVLSVSGYVQKKAGISRARTEIASFELRVEQYKLDNGVYPANLAAVTGSAPADPWALPYVYAAPGSRNQITFDLSSAGPDRVAGTADDITNWR